MDRAVESTVWWAVLVGCWLTTLSSFDMQDFVLAAATAVPCAVIATTVRREYGGHWRPASAWTLPIDIVRGSGLLFSPRTALRHIPVDDARKAVTTVIVSASPHTVVLDDEGDSLLVHELGRE